MFSQLLGAVVRAAIVVLVVATPSLLLPGTTPEGAQMVTLVALALGVFVAMEYAASYPALVEFRDAPPFNRVRMLTFFLTLFCLSLVGRMGDDSALVLVLNSLGLLVGRALDFTGSPLTAMMAHLPGGPGGVTALKAQIMAGLAVFIMLSGLCVFVTLLRLRHWPNRDVPFNVWINLPTFDPTKGGDVVTRLTRDARVNIILGFSLPFLIPLVAALAADSVGVVVHASPQTMVWGISLWTFLPLSLLMRGLAMGRIADMIAAKRARLTAGLEVDGPRTALQHS